MTLHDGSLGRLIHPATPDRASELPRTTNMTIATSPHLWPSEATTKQSARYKAAFTLYNRGPLLSPESSVSSPYLTYTPACTPTHTNVLLTSPPLTSYTYRIYALTHPHECYTPTLHPTHLIHTVPQCKYQHWRVS